MSSSGVMGSNLLANLRNLRDSRASWMWVGMILGIQAIVSLLGGHQQPFAGHWFQTLGLSREGMFSGQVWQIFTYAFLHGNWLHAGLNSLLILLVGSRIEHMAGRGMMSIATVFGILGGGIFHLLLTGAGGEGSLLVGISGGCVSLLLLLTTLSPQSRMMPLPVSGRSLGLGILTAEMVLALIDPAAGLPGLSGFGDALVERGMGSWFQLGHACHAGGGLAGWATGRWLLRPRVTLNRLRAERDRREAIGSKRNG